MISARFVPPKHYTNFHRSSLLCLVFSTVTNYSEHAQLDVTPLRRECANYKKKKKKKNLSMISVNLFRMHFFEQKYGKKEGLLIIIIAIYISLTLDIVGSFFHDEVSSTGCPKTHDPFLKCHISETLFCSVKLTTCLERANSSLFWYQI